MKIKVDVDCTPDEARRFLGLPDIAPMQQRMMEAMEQRLVEAVNGDRHPGAARPVAAGRDEGPGAVAGLWTQMAQAAMGFPKPPEEGGRKR